METDDGSVSQSGYVGKIKKEKCGTFLYMIWQTSRDIYNTMTFGEEKEKLDVLFTKFETDCKLKHNITVERYRFNMHTQETNNRSVCN